MKELVEVFFSVIQDENGWPPLSCERIWCLPSDDDVFVVDNIPFYARDISFGDEVQTEESDGVRWFASLVKPSGNTTLRVFALNKAVGPLLIPKLRALGGLTEKMEGSDFIAVSLPPSADIAQVLDFLDRESNNGNLAFEESSVRYL